MAYYTLFKGNNNQYYWNLKTDNHEIICQSEGYVSKQGAEKGIAACKANAAYATVRDKTQYAA